MPFEVLKSGSYRVVQQPGEKQVFTDKVSVKG